METINHIFLTSILAQKLWGSFVVFVGFNPWRTSLSNKVQEWLRFTGNFRGKSILNPSQQFRLKNYGISGIQRDMKSRPHFI